MTKMIFKNAWQYARKLANKLGGRASEYIGYGNNDFNNLQ